MKFIHETDIEEKALPGRFLRWAVGKNGGLDSSLMSCSIIRVQAGQTVSPAHEHPDGEELLYIISGSGHVYVGGKICPVREGSLVLLEQGLPHMVRNSGEKELKIVCFFAPATTLEEFVFHPEIDFDRGEYIKAWQRESTE